MNMTYERLVGRICAMDESEYVELAYDLIDEMGVDRFEDMVDAFVFVLAKVKKVERAMKSELSQDEDALEVDNARRERELK